MCRKIISIFAIAGIVASLVGCAKHPPSEDQGLPAKVYAGTVGTNKSTADFSRKRGDLTNDDADEDPGSITVHQQTREEAKVAGGFIPMKLWTLDSDAQKRLADTLAVPNLKAITDDDLGGRPLTSILPLKKIRSIWVADDSNNKQTAAQRMTDPEVVGIFRTAKVIPAPDLKREHVGPAGFMVLTTDKGDNIFVQLLLNRKGVISLPGRTLHFQYEVKPNSKGSVGP